MPLRFLNGFDAGTVADAVALFVCAAGNQGDDVGRTGFYPAGFRLDNVIAVAASDAADELACNAWPLCISPRP